MSKLADDEFLRVTVCEGKYTYVQDSKGSRVLRYNEALRDCTGDGFILALAQRIQAQADEIKELREDKRSLASAMLSVNRGSGHAITIEGFLDPCYWQRKEWVDWIADEATTALAATE